MPEPLLKELSKPGLIGVRLPEPDVPVKPLTELFGTENLRSDPPPLPELDQPTVVRHFVRLSQLNYSVDTHFYPLGSCTMKHNPKVDEEVAKLPEFAMLHPLQDEETVQGILRLLKTLEQMLCEIGGMDACTLQGSAGAQGEFIGLLLVRAWHRYRGEGEKRTRIIVPDSAHGTNPASAARCGFAVESVPSGPDGCIDLSALEKALQPDPNGFLPAAVMVTNPNTLGKFERDIVKVAELTHEAGALLYYDGANLNAIMGKAKPGDMGCDIMHFNLHKTFSTPHGGGGPGSGPVAVKSFLEPFLPVPVIEEKDGKLVLSEDRPLSVGRVHSFYGNVLVAVKAYAYIRSLGAEGLTKVTEDAVLNANYLMHKLANIFPVAFPGLCKHEFVLSLKQFKRETGVRTWDVAKRLLDYGFYAPTVYFPITVEEAMMVEPTETERKETLDAFAAALEQIAREARERPEVVQTAPHKTPVGRLDEAKAARELKVRW
ncbi:aminomethyl-transferring glycine dehydrogenase subunit GcvPB [Fervidibacter sacchari]|uniref:Probable glycine dehydrogenase (decarboxylating) subunit 2 n=1 Tax=Candidatus Fervidibacter sacchari TaxID=1448929 RepID=A0ABT2ERU0_9BACT|nr:aminomethyl-transferring glycine dehydrogenase subunit GcvPB [Candidatus Fervidibacter sacchari]MCS3920688.1 glycine dehydrogenase subunit 2 [Candidatus Fervidibacter sacchari]WKU16340.1 aminomethyl-transferring glycine dehydrogenase subunit GcvPB [Candidatus Fervidibacter sacchari]